MCNAGTLTDTQTEGLGSDWFRLTGLQVDPKEPPPTQPSHGKPALAPCYCLEKEVKSQADRMKIMLEISKDFSHQGAAGSHVLLMSFIEGGRTEAVSNQCSLGTRWPHGESICHTEIY